jgi:hypothetical protein
MDRWAARWGDRLRIQHKVWLLLLLLCCLSETGLRWLHLAEIGVYKKNLKVLGNHLISSPVGEKSA